jgi:hypothetical protein
MIYKIFLLFLEKDKVDICQTYTPKSGAQLTKSDFVRHKQVIGYLKKKTTHEKRTFRKI